MKRIREARSHLREATDLLRQALALENAAKKGEISEKAAAMPATRLLAQAISESDAAKRKMRAFVHDMEKSLHP